MTMTGGVVLTQCRNVMKGDRLLVDMTTGTSRVEADNGKVQLLFLPGQGCGEATPGCRAPPSPGNWLDTRETRSKFNTLVNSSRPARLKRAGGACIYRAATTA